MAPRLAQSALAAMQFKQGEMSRAVLNHYCLDLLILEVIFGYFAIGILGKPLDQQIQD